ncbi:MAG: carbamoyltransferase HypF [Candidatus Heimdallarchaeota archaeon]|nr:carbamoyltransferase HypF [Candidatus Heimdallarchaeota archaeon]
MKCRILINGVVQGIGFRPFVYNLAVNYNLKGFVLNRGDAGVEIQVKGKKKEVLAFINDLKANRPVLAKYDIFNVQYEDFMNLLDQYDQFVIEKSTLVRGVEGSYIPPDLPICDKCLNDMQLNERRKNYPFTSCVDCGPRYTVITSLPYDRPRTVMNKFPFCKECLEDYTNPKDRRFHAQTTCCWNCGPKYFLIDKKGQIIISKSDFHKNWTLISKLLNEGKILAIKGIGGTHIACGTLNDTPIDRLRKWKGGRGNKPFAVMSHNLREIDKYAIMNESEKELLTSLPRPIVLLNKKEKFPLSPLISPGLHNIGVLLPYSGIHHMITEKMHDPALIMTSANLSNVPMLIENYNIQNQLSDVVDYLLLHDREIFQRADDSILKVHKTPDCSRSLFIRRSRGYVPEPISLPWKVDRPIVALGAEMYNVGAIGIGSKCFATQHIGHMTSLENEEFFSNSLNHIKQLLGVKTIGAIGADLHPDFTTTNMGKRMSSELDIPFYQFQHHFSHLGSLAIENEVKFDEKVICVALDGTGYGPDNTIWGGEILLGNYSNFDRLAHLEQQILLGGDKAVSEPYRMLISILLSQRSIDELTINLEKIPSLSWIPKTPNYSLICQQLEKIIYKKSKIGFNITSSCGRLLDTISILVGASQVRTYEGEPAIKLESFAEQAVKYRDLFRLKLSSSENKSGLNVIHTSVFIEELLSLLSENIHPYKVALAAEVAIAHKFADLAFELANEHKINKIGLSGGVTFNRTIFTEFYHRLVSRHSAKDYLIYHKHVPPGDGGIAIGQVPLLATHFFKK